MTVTLKDLVQFLQMGYQPREAVQGDPQGTHWLIQMRDLTKGGTVRRDTLVRIQPERVPDPYLVREGDVLLKVRGASHTAGVVSGLPPATMASNHFYILRPGTPGILPEYLAWYINQPPAQTELSRGTQGSGSVTVVRRTDFENLEIPVPPLAVQEHITALDRLQRREQELTDSLLARRARLLGLVCLNAVQTRTIITETP